MNYDKTTINDNFKEKPIAELPQATKYTHACAPLCQRLLSIIEICTCSTETAKASKEIPLETEKLQEINQPTITRSKEIASASKDIPLETEQLTSDVMSVGNNDDGRGKEEEAVATSRPEGTNDEAVTIRGRDLIFLAIENDLHMLLEFIISELGVNVDEDILSKACTIVQGRTTGSPWTIRFLVDTALRQTNKTGGLYFGENQDRVKSVRAKHHLSHRQYTLLIELLEKLEVIKLVGTETATQMQNEIYALQNEIYASEEGKRRRAMKLCRALGLSDVINIWWASSKR